MPRKAGKNPQIRLSPENTAKLKRLVKITRRNLAQEVNVAVAAHIEREAMRAEQEIALAGVQP